MMPKVVILAGGPATRLYPITHSVPKAMIEVAGKPFIAHQLELLKKNGIENVVICLGYLGERIKDFIKEGEDFGIKVEYSFDGEKLLGTGGAINKALNLLDDVFFVMYGDSYLRADFKAISDYFLSRDKKGLMTVIKNQNRWDKSNVVYNKGKIIKYDKKNPTADMEYIDYGLALLKKEIFSQRNYGQVFGLDRVYEDLIQEGEMLAYEVKKRFFEIGSLSGLEETRKYLEEMSKMKNNGSRNES
jgi:NDP-sugar pyrophosphorylase family protein